MSALVKLTGKLPGDKETDLNGLDRIAAELIDNPGEIRCAVVWFDVARIVEDIDNDDRIPTVRIRSIEPVDGELGTSVAKLGLEARTARTGMSELDFGDE